uniref:Mitochondrial import receptor subunit TOM22 homolog n=1 Tax=Canis lupus familiaris TaxID=9615 RepID=A0A8P0P432_CANLF
PSACPAGGPGTLLSPDKLLPKGNAEKTEEEQERKTTVGSDGVVPERVRPAAGATFDVSLFVAQTTYRFSRAASWIGTTCFTIPVLPVVFETEKLQVERQQQVQQRQIVWGPNTGVSAGMPVALPSKKGRKSWKNLDCYCYMTCLGGTSLKIQ